MTPTQQRQLEAELAEIEAGIQVFEELAAHDPDSVVEGWVGTSKSRGTAGKPSQAKDYLTVRSYEPREAWHGKRTKRIPVGHQAMEHAYREACDLGQRLRRLRRKRDRICRLLGRIIFHAENMA